MSILLVDYQTYCPYKNVQFLSFAHILFVNKLSLLTQVFKINIPEVLNVHMNEIKNN